MNDNEIIKALEKCLKNDILQKQCINCDYRKHGNLCMDILLNQTLDLINHQQADNERLKKLLAEADTAYNKCAKRFYKEGVKELAKRLKEKKNLYVLVTVLPLMQLTSTILTAF